MSSVFYRFKSKISTAYEPGEFLCVDESLAGFRGKMGYFILEIF